MRTEHIRQRIDQQYELRKSIKDFASKLTEDGDENLNPVRIKTRRDFLKEQWQEFKVNHLALNVGINTLSKPRKAELLQRSYFKRKHFESTQRDYVEALEKANILIADRSTPLRENSTSRFSTATGESNRVIHHAPRLPQLDFPKFNGSMLDWLSFRAVFEKMVVDNQAVDVIFKAHYLKAAMTGSAANFLNSTTITEENFKSTRDQLIDFYHNERVLLHHALHSAATMKKMSRESAAELELLYSTAKQIRNTLELLKRTMPGIDDFLVYFTTQRFDPETLKAWELQLGATKNPPTWDKLATFTVSRLLTLKSYESSSNPKTASSSSGIKVHHAEGTSSGHAPFIRPTPSCVLCPENHFLSRCPQYLNKTTQQRDELVTKHNRCYNCLGNHHSNSCPSPRRCMKCGKKHHTTLHCYSKSGAEATAEAHVNHVSKFSSSPILLATAKLVLLTNNGEKAVVRALVDQGSEVSLISERVVQQLHLEREPTSIPIIGIGGHATSTTRGAVNLEVGAHFNTAESLKVLAYVLPKLTSSLPSTNSMGKIWPHLKGLKLADPEFCNTGPIDLILGADVYGQILEEGIIKGPALSPTAQRTRFGWIIFGPSGSEVTVPAMRTFHANIDYDLHEALQRFWVLDEVPKSLKSTLSSAEDECEKHFQSTHSRDEKGRYVVRLPFKAPPSQLGESRPKALRMLYSLQRKFNINPGFKQAYTDFIEEYKKLQHLAPVPDSAPEPEFSNYLPHHGVLKETSLTTKLRVVFNGSSITTSGKTLNDLLHSGPKLQIDLFDVLLFFRSHRVVFSGDIEKFYRQIKVHPADWKFQRILWLSGGKIVTYELTTVTYGLGSAAFLALRALHQLILDEGHRFPLAIQALKRGRYVDDITGGADTVQEAQTQIEQITELCMAGGFPIQKWNSNHPAALEKVPKERRIETLSKPIEGNPTVTHALGLAWQATADTFQFTIKLTAEPPITKRKVLSAIAQIFDPLGLLSPIIIVAKVFVQELWSFKLEWDEELSQDLSNTWSQYIQQLGALRQLSIPRWLQTSSQSRIEVHGFCDASQKAMAAAVYIRVSNSEGPIATLVCAKTKVAPLKRLTIPRLELCAAVLLAKLLSHVISSMDWKNHPIYCWTDSSITYTWINNQPSRWKEFVHNRVCFIQEALPAAQWRFVPGKTNPADCATRGLSTAELIQHSLWWNGPSWLTQSSEFWPKEVQADYIPENLEERPAAVNVIAQTPEPVLQHLFDRFSTLKILIGATVFFNRAVARFKRQANASLLTNPITPGDLEEARIYWIKHIQASSYTQEIQILKKGEQLPRNHPLVRLTPWLDPIGLLRVGG